MQFGDGQNIQLEAKISKGLAHVLTETPLTKSQQLTPTDEGALLQVSIHDSWQLRWWLLSQGEQIEVIQPESLRQHMIDSLKNALSNYR